MQQDKYWIQCNCGSEVLLLERGDDLAFLSVYSYYPRLDWKSRLRTVWKIIRTGTPFTDQIVLGREELKGLKEAIKSTTKEIEHYERIRTKTTKRA
jgi:hypothetical protein